MKTVFFGMGSIGQRHAELIHKKFKHDLYAFRSGKSNVKLPDYVTELKSWNEVKKLKPDVAFITNPTSLHIDTAIKCAEIDCNLFIEKPIDSKLKNLDKLLRIVKRKKLVTYLAYNRRFHPVITELKKYFTKNEQGLSYGNKFLHLRSVNTSYYPDWRAGDYKKRYTAIKKMGGGIVLDLSHEIDYTSYLLGNIKNMSGIYGKRGSVTVDSEDYADILVQTKSGPGNIHLDFFSHKVENKIEINFENLTVIGDLSNSEISEVRNGNLIAKKQFPTERNISFENQLDYFFANIDNPKMMNNLIDAAILFKQIIKFKKTYV